MTTNLYRIDDVLLRTGLIMGVFAVLAISKILAAGALSLSGVAWLVLLVACPVTLLVIGRNMRRREKLVVEIWRLVESQGQVPVDRIHQMSSFSRRQIEAAVERINSKANAMLVWDETSGVIRDDSVRRHTLTHSEDCESCGGSVNVEISSYETDYTCPFCGAGLDCGRINSLLGRLHTLEGSQQQQKFVSTAVAAPLGNKINIALFVILLVIFWPAAVFYALKAYNS